jgi:hypothetical protein
MLNIASYFIEYACRWSSEMLWSNGEKKWLKVIPPGQFFRLKSKNIKKIARDGILRNSFFRKLGYGEFIIHNWKNGGKNGKLLADAQA